MAKTKTSKKEKTGFLSIELTRCPACGSKEITVKRATPNVYYDYCPACGNMFNRTVIS